MEQLRAQWTAFLPRLLLELDTSRLLLALHLPIEIAMGNVLEEQLPMTAFSLRASHQHFLRVALPLVMGGCQV